MAPERALAYKRHAVVSPKPRGPDATMRLVAGVVCVAAACIGLARGEPTCTVSFPTRDQSGFETWKGTCFPTEGGTIQSCVSNEIMLVANSERYSTDENYFTYLEGCERDPSTAMHCCTRLDTDRKNGIQNIMVGLSANSTKLIQSAWPEAECPAEGSCEVHCVKGDLDRCANIASVLMHAEAGDVRLSSVVVNHKKNLLSEEDERLAQASVSGDEFVYLGASGFAIFIFGTLLVWWRRRKYKEAKEEYKRMIDENTESLTSRV